MKLKRIFPNGVKVTSAGEEFDSCVVRIEHLSPVWHVSPKLMQKGVGEGWMSVAKRQITLHTEDGVPDVAYDIVAPPSRADGRLYYDCKVVNHG